MVYVRSTIWTLLNKLSSRLPDAGSRSRTGDQGLVMVEATFGLLFLLIIVISTADISRYIMARMMLEQGAREAAYTGARAPWLTNVSITNLDLSTTTLPSPPYSAATAADACNVTVPSDRGLCANFLMHSRARHIIRRHGHPALGWNPANSPVIWGVNVNEAVIESRFTVIAAVPPSTVPQRNVYARVTGEYRGMIFNLTVTGEYEAPYLF